MKKTFVLISLFLLLVSCSNKSMLRQKQIKQMFKSDLGQQIEVVKKDKNYTSDDEFLKYFDLGILLHYNRQYDSSLVCLHKAEKIADELYTKSLTNEAASLLINDNIRPYRPKPYEEIMLHNFIAMNYLALNRYDEALVESRKGSLVLDRLAGETPKKYCSDGFFNYWSALVYDDQGESDNSQISLYHSLKGYQRNQKFLPTELSAFAYNAFKNGGRDNDIAEFNLIPADKQSDKIQLIDSLKKELVIICYGGITPHLEEMKYWGTYLKDGLLVLYHKDPNRGTVSETMPAPVIASGDLNKREFSGRTYHVSFAIPVKKQVQPLTSSFQAVYNGKTYNSENVANTDALLGQYLDDESSTILTRTVIRVVLRTIAAEKAKQALESKNTKAKKRHSSGSEWLNLLANLAIDIFADQLEMADLRSGIYLPNTIQLIRIPYQNDNEIKIKALSDNGLVLKSELLKLDSNNLNRKQFVFYNSLE